MTLNDKIQEIFCLNEGGELFQHAITPKSCGGTDYFKYLALIGDKIFDIALIDIISESEACDTGYLRTEIMKIHNERTLSKLGFHLKLDQLMSPIDDNHKPTSNEIKESVEALIGASYKINGINASITIIKELMKFIILVEKTPDSTDMSGYLDCNYIGILQENLQKLGEPLPEYKYSDNLGLDHEPLFYCLLEVNFQGVVQEIKSDLFRKKKDAQRQAAQKILISLGLMDNISIEINGSNLSTGPATIMGTATKSFDERVIIFESHKKKGSYSKLSLSTNTGEAITDYAFRKAKKNPYSLLLLLNARLNTFSGASWTAEMSQGYLVLLNFQIEDSLFFEVGFGSSKTKARKDASKKIIMSSDLMRLLEDQFSNHYI